MQFHIDQYSGNLLATTDDTVLAISSPAGIVYHKSSTELQPEKDGSVIHQLLTLKGVLEIVVKDKVIVSVNLNSRG